MPGILVDGAIRKAIADGAVEIEPYNPDQINPASYDITLGSGVAVYKQWVHTWGHRWFGAEDGRFFTRRNAILDVRFEPQVAEYQIDPQKGWVLKPGIGYLMHAHERVTTGEYVIVVDGKSSIGRLFLQVHATAGYIDPGFDGQYTLEVIVQHPIRVFPGMRLGQIRFHTAEGELENDYSKVGHYKKEAARGAVASKAWRQFTEGR
jgi:dCTP deaminase